MRWIWVFVFLIAAVFGFAQGSIFKSVRPEATVVVRKHNTGADLVEVTVLDPKYLEADLREKVLALGKSLQSDPRGLVIFAQDAGVAGSFLKAKFAVDGLIRGGVERFALANVIQAFAFGNKPLKQLSVIFDAESPDANTVSRYKGPKDAFQLEAISTTNPKGIEYRVVVSTDDPSVIRIPVRGEKAPEPVVAKTSNMDPLTIALIIVGAIAAGLLVYSVARRSRLRARS